MTDLQPGDRVVCIDATPLPINSPGDTALDFSFPAGFLVEGTIYCVENVYLAPIHSGVTLVGLPVLRRGLPLPWNCHRFRKIRRRRVAPSKAAASINSPARNPLVPAAPQKPDPSHP